MSMPSTALDEDYCPILNKSIWTDLGYLSQIEVDDYQPDAQKTKDTLTQIHTLANRILQSPRKQDEESSELINEYMAQVQANEIQITRLNQELTDARAVSTALATRGNHVIQEKPESMPDPVKFSGDRLELRPFLVQLKIKLAVNAARFPTPQHALGYAVGLLGGTALAQLIPYVNGAHVNLPDMEAFYAILENAFGDPDRVATATRELENLKQANREFSIYFADFQRLISELDWNDSAKRHALTRGLCNELKDGLVWQPEIEDFDGFVRQLQTLDKKFRARIAEQKKSVANTSKASTAKNHTSPAMASAKNQTVGHPTQTGSGYYGAAPMDLSAGRNHISQEERTRRKDSNLCYACADPNHRVKDCPLRTQKLQGSIAGVRQTESVNEGPAGEAGKV